MVLGNCGVGVAPCRPADREVTAADLTNLEAIPTDVLRYFALAFGTGNSKRDSTAISATASDDG